MKKRNLKKKNLFEIMEKLFAPSPNITSRVKTYRNLRILSLRNASEKAKFTKAKLSRRFVGLSIYYFKRTESFITFIEKFAL